MRTSGLSTRSTPCRSHAPPISVEMSGRSRATATRHRHGSPRTSGAPRPRAPAGASVSMDSRVARASPGVGPQSDSVPPCQSAGDSTGRVQRPSAMFVPRTSRRVRLVAARDADSLGHAHLGPLAPPRLAAGARWCVATPVPATARAVAAMHWRRGISTGHSRAVGGSGHTEAPRHPWRSPTRRRELTYDSVHADDAHSRDGPR